MVAEPWIRRGRTLFTLSGNDGRVESEAEHGHQFGSECFDKAILKLEDCDTIETQEIGFSDRSSIQRP